MRRGLLIDYYYCTGCRSCEVACDIEHGYPVGQFGIKVAKTGPWEYAPDKWQLSYVPIPTDQCDLCADRFEQGKEPMCVQSCQAKCLEFGTYEELKEKMADKDKTMIIRP